MRAELIDCPLEYVAVSLKVYFAPKYNTTEHQLWKVNIVSDNGLLPAGIKPLYAPMLTHIYVAIGRH